MAVIRNCLGAAGLGLVLAGSLSGQVPDSQFSAEELARECRLAVAAEIGSLRSLTEVFPEVMGCIRYVTGFQHGLSVAATSMGRSSCMPSNSNAGQWVRVFVKYVDEHPEELNRPAAQVLLAALARAYACK